MNRYDKLLLLLLLLFFFFEKDMRNYLVERERERERIWRIEKLLLMCKSLNICKKQNNITLEFCVTLKYLKDHYMLYN